MNDSEKSLAAALAKAIVALCVRNTFLEDLHAGTTPSSKTGDYSDVKVVTPYGEIPWNKLSRISDEEMKCFMKEVVNYLYTFLCRQKEEGFMEPFLQWGNKPAAHWDEPEFVTDFVVPSAHARKHRQ